MFVEEYIVDLNATQAAIRAGYSKRQQDKLENKTCQNLTLEKQLMKDLLKRKRSSL